MGYIFHFYSVYNYTVFYATHSLWCGTLFFSVCMNKMNTAMPTVTQNITQPYQANDLRKKREVYLACAFEHLKI